MKTLNLVLVMVLATVMCAAQNFSATTPAQNAGMPSDFVFTTAGVVCVGAAGACNGNNISASDIGTWVFGVTATDTLGNKSPVTQITLSIGANCVITITPTTLPGGQIGKPYSQQLTALGTGGCGGSFTWQLATNPNPASTTNYIVPVPATAMKLIHLTDQCDSLCNDETPKCSVSKQICEKVLHGGYVYSTQ